MIVRTPPAKKRRSPEIQSPPPSAAPGPLIIYEDDHPPVVADSSSHLCTYQCRQMVKSDLLDAFSNAEKQVEEYKSQLEASNENFRKVDLERKTFKEQYLSTEQELAAAKGRIQALQEQQLKEVHDFQERFSKQIHSYSELELERMERKAHNAEKESQLLKGQLDDLKIRLNECLQQKSEVETKLSRLTFEEVKCADNGVLVKHLQEELRNLEAEVRAARKLKSSLEDMNLLNEKLLEEKGRRERAESELSKLQEFQLSMKKLEDELTSWKSMTESIPGVSCCDDIPVKFGALQKEVIDSMKREGEATAHLKQLEVTLEAALIGKQNVETEAKLMRERLEVTGSEIKRIESLLSRVTEERDKLRNGINEFKVPKSDCAGDEATSQTLKELEPSLAKKEGYIKELESYLSEQKQVNTCQHEEIKSLNERLKTEARKVKSLEREGAQMRSEISLLESKLGHGDFSAANTKVLRMVNTLSVDNEAKQTIEALRTELQKTKERLQAVQELKSHSGESGRWVDSDISGKIVQLKEQIATLEKREERYKTVFADRISVFRRACCELFGYKIVMDEHQRPNGISVTRFTLQSIYAQSDDEKLEFEYESGTTNIMVNEYTSQRDISQQVDIFIKKMNSIPAFTANLTVESFNRRTLC